MAPSHEKVLIKTPKGVVIRSLDQILYVKAEGSYCVINFLNGDHFILSKNLSQLKLPDDSFFRIHASIIINLRYVKRVENSLVILSNEQELPIAKRRRGKFLSTLNNNYTNL
ncbi:LytR/AlgR family response regulator transcription factor [Ascidiimonas sp. W6]|uniref:LytR/AlgR family response regulator transcription factor n=1 Tax=Ascidiimonas meishanensis TaxID=3128903 RepID=UPI0030EC72B7